MRKSIFLSLILLLSICRGIAAPGPLSTGRWAKVSVDTTGIFEISYESLRELGFSDPERVAVYGTGGVIAADHSFSGPFGDGFAPAPAMHTADKRLLFFAEGPVRAEMSSTTRLSIKQNHYDSRSYYFLSDKDGAPELATAVLPATNTPAEHSHNHILFYDRQTFSPANGGAIMLSQKLMAGQSEDYPFSIEGYDRSSDTPAGIYCEYGIKMDQRSALAMSVSEGFEIEDLIAPQVSASTNSNEAYRRGTISACLRPDNDTENGTLTFKANTGSMRKFMAVDFLYVIYPRTNTLGKASCLTMNYVKAPGAVEFSGTPADLVVWDVTPGSPATNLRTADTSSRRFETGNATRLVAFSPSEKQRRICSAERIDNQDYSSVQTPDILIIAAPALMAEAEELAEIHRRYQGAEVFIAAQDRIFNEFSEGSRTPMAFRRLAKKLYDRNPSKLKHIILYGTGSFDNQRIDNSGSSLVTFQAETTEESRWSSYNYCADQYFGMLSDDYDHSRVIFMPMSVNVGRITASSPAEGASYNAKVRRFFEAGPQPTAYLRAVMYSDLGDKYQHLDQNDEACAALEADGLRTVARTDKYFYESVSPSNTFPSLEKIAGNALTRGAGYLGYCGHGSPGMMGSVIYKSFVDTYNYDPAPFGMFATCETFAFDRGGFSICDYMLEKENGGVIAMLGSGRSVILNYNRRLSTEIARCYSELKPGATYGDLLRLARQRILSENTTASVCRNTMCYNFGGDPALPVPVPEYGIRLDPDDDAVFTPLKAKTISGYICNADGSVAEGFDGTVEIDIHKSTITRVNLTDTETIKSATDGHAILCTTVADVKAGRFRASLTVPVSADRNTSNRISMAATDISGLIAAGTDLSYTVAAEPAQNGDIDMTAPEILSAYVDSDTFRPGDIVGNRYIFHATVDPSPSGLRISSELERSVKLSLDGRVSIPAAAAYARSDDAGLVHFDVPFPETAPGKHTISLEVANNIGATASMSIDFIVGTGTLTAVLAHDKGATAVARDNVEFTLEEAGAANARLIIVDRSGRTVLSVPDCAFPYRWNLTDSDGIRVSDGQYRVWALLNDGHVVGSTEAVHLTVLRPREGNK